MSKILKAGTAKLADLQNNQLQKLRNGNITLEQFEWFNNLSYRERQTLMDVELDKEMLLKLISGEEKVKLDAVDGTETITNSKRIFSYPDCEWGTNEENSPREETVVEVYKLVKKATFDRIFRSLSSDLNKLCLTQNQILNFIDKHKNWLPERYGSGNFFLLKSNRQFSVAQLYFYDSNPFPFFAVAHSIERGGLPCPGEYTQFNFIVPQLTSL